MVSGHGLDLPWQRELDLGIVELLDAGTTALVRSHFLHFDDLNGGSSSSVPSTHVSIALRDGASGGEITVLAIHVVGAGARVVTQPDSEVFHRRRFLLVDLLARHNFAVSLFDLLETVEVIPEPGLGDNSVGGEDAHPEERRDAQLFGRELTSNDAVLDQVSLGLHFPSFSSLNKIYFKQIETTQL